jgi:predicted nuclease with TOPRIM domain
MTPPKDRAKRPSKAPDQPPPDQPPPDQPPPGPGQPAEEEDPWRLLAAARAQIEELTKQRDDLQQRLDQAQGTIGDLQERIGQLSALADQLQSVTAERDNLRGKLDEAQSTIRKLQEQVGRLSALADQLQPVTTERDDLRRKLDEALAKISDLQEQVGRLNALADQLAAVTIERDDLRRQLAEAQASLSQRVADAVQAHLQPIIEAHAGELSAITAERDDLRAQLTDLQQQGTETATTMTATDLAANFVGVLNSLAQPAEPPPPGQPFAAAVTTINVQAKGLLRAPEHEGGEVQLVTVDAGKVDPTQLSTVSLDVKLLPHMQQIPATPTEPQPDE